MAVSSPIVYEVNDREQSDRWQSWLLPGLLALCSTLPVILARFPPLFDYPYWVLEAHVLANIANYNNFYDFVWLIQPNLGSDIMLVPFTLFLGAEVAGRVVIAIYLFAFSFTFALLVRSIAGGATGAELLGPVFAYNTFFYTGNISFILGLPWMFLATRVILSEQGRQTARRYIIISALSVLALVFHLFAWLPILALVSVVFLLSPSTRARRFIAATQVVPVIILMSYIVQRLWLQSDIAHSTTFYTAITTKLIGFVSPVLFFTRIDPFPAPFPTFYAGLALMGAIICLFFVRHPVQRFRSLGKPSRPLLGVSLLLFIISFGLPFSWVAGMGQADGRLYFVGVLFIIAALSQWTLGRNKMLFAAAIVIAAMGGQVVIWTSANGYLLKAYRALQIRPQNASVFAASITDAPRGDCLAAPWAGGGRVINLLLCKNSFRMTP